MRGPSLWGVCTGRVFAGWSRSGEEKGEDCGRRETGAEVIKAAADTEGDDDVGDGDDTDNGDNGGRSVSNDETTVGTC